MTAGHADLVIEAGATWRRTVTVRDDSGALVALAAPAYMDIRTGQSAAAVLVARLDTASGITVEADGSLTLLLDDAATVLLPAGDYWYDLFAAQGGQPVRVLAGRVTVVPNVSVAP